MKLGRQTSKSDDESAKKEKLPILKSKSKKSKPDIEKEGKGLKIMTHNQLLTRLPIL